MTRFCIAVISFLAIALTSVAQVGDLPRSTPEEQGVDSRMLSVLYHRLSKLHEVDIHHMMVLRHGKVISELHATPYRATDLHTMYSASKTVTALAVGLAIDDGLLTVKDKVSKHLRDKMPSTLSPALDSLTVRDMLMMAAGRQPDLSIPEGDADWLTAWFAGEFSNVGQRFIYDSMCTHALAMIVSRLTGKRVLDYVRERIFTPLHITEADWELAPDSVETAGWGLRLHAESEAKLGLLMLHGGKWDDKQLVSQQWIKEMTRMHISTKEPAPKLPLKQRILNFLRSIWHTIRSWFTGYNIDHYYLGYGYQTKAIQHPRAESFFAAGYGGQLIYVVPKLDMVFVINGRAANYGDELNTIYYSFVDPLIGNQQPPDKVPTFQLAIDMPQGDGTHPLESQLLGNTIILEDNLLGLNTIEVNRQGEDLQFIMTDHRGPLRAIAGWSEWRFTVSDERPIYIMECRNQLDGTRRPFTSIAAYAWQNDTLVMRLDWLDGGDNRRLKMTFNGNDVTVVANDNFDPLLTDTIHGKIKINGLVPAV